MIYIQFLVSFHHFSSHNSIEIPDFGTPWIVFAVFFLQIFEPENGVVHQMLQVIFYFLYFFLNTNDSIICLVGIEFCDSHHLYFQQFEDIFAGYLTDKILFERFQPTVDMGNHFVLIRTFFKFPVLIYSVLYEYFFKRNKKQLIQQFIALYDKFLLQQIAGMIGADA